MAKTAKVTLIHDDGTKMRMNMKVYFYKRSGQRVTKQAVLKARDQYARGKRTGLLGGLSCRIQVDVADRVEKMTAIEFCNWSGQFTYRTR